MAKRSEALQSFVSFEPHSGGSKLRQIQEQLESEIEELRERIEYASDRGLVITHLAQRLDQAMSELSAVRSAKMTG